MSLRPSRSIYWLNLTLCVAGTFLFLAFAVGLESGGSWADRLLKLLVARNEAVIGALLLGGVFCVWYFFLRKR